MNVFWVAGATPTGTIAPEQEKAFREATVVFIGAVLSVIGDKLVDAYLHMQVAKDLWEALESKFGTADAGSEMYTIDTSRKRSYSPGWEGPLVRVFQPGLSNQD